MLPTLSYDDVRAAFKAANVDFIEEFHGSVYKTSEGKKVKLNETFEALHKTFGDPELFAEFIADQERRFTANSAKAKDMLEKDKTIMPLLSTDSETAKARLDRVMHAYFVMDTVLSNEYNKMMVGDACWHASKVSDSDIQKEAEAEATKAIAEQKIPAKQQLKFKSAFVADYIEKHKLPYNLASR